MEGTAIPYFWALVVIGGPLLLGAALLFASWRNKRSQARKNYEERAARRQKEAWREERDREHEN